MKVESKFVVDVMAPNPVTVGPDTDVSSAERLARTRSVHDLLVVSGYQLAGVVCRCELYLASGRTVADCMCANPVTIDDQSTVGVAVDLMRRHAVGCLPVVDWSGSLRGVVTSHDLADVGALGDGGVRRCDSCGSTHGLAAGQGRFCALCLEIGRPASSFGPAHFERGRAA